MIVYILTPTLERHLMVGWRFAISFDSLSSTELQPLLETTYFSPFSCREDLESTMRVHFFGWPFRLVLSFVSSRDFLELSESWVSAGWLVCSVSWEQLFPENRYQLTQMGTMKLTSTRELSSPDLSVLVEAKAPLPVSSNSGNIGAASK